MRRAAVLVAVALAGCGSAKSGSAWEAADAYLEPTRPDALVASVVTERNFAIVGWISGARGGRILLKAQGRGWEPILCGGDRMKQRVEIQRAGVPDGTAGQLVTKLLTAEAKVDEFILRRLSRFEPETCPGLPTVG